MATSSISPSMSVVEEKKQPQPDYKKREFDCCDVEWVIEKFCLASCRENWSFDSPEFTVRGYHTTKWLMTLKCTSGCNIVQLHLKRSTSDDGPDKIWVDWRITVASEGHDHRTVNILCCFKRGTRCSEDLVSEVSVMKALKPYEPDSLIIRCKFIFYGEDTRNNFRPCTNADLNSLSEDLHHLFLAGQGHDLELRFNDKTLLAHKVIVCSRIEGLNNLLEHERWRVKESAETERDMLDLSYLNYLAMRKVLEYAYSGDLRHVLAEPSLAVYDCVSKLGMSEIVSYYTPDKLSFRTIVESNEIVFRWLIPNINNLMRYESLTSPILTDDHFQTTWQLHIFHENEANIDYLAVKAEATEETDPMDLCLEVAVTDKNDARLFPRRVRCSNEILKMYGFVRFMSVNAVKSVSDDGCLRIVARLRMSEGVSSSYTARHDILYKVCIPGDQGFSMLSADMHDSLTSAYFSDLHIETCGNVFKLHKCVVSARSEGMRDRILRKEDKDDEEEADMFSDVESDTFTVLLKYVYTGVYEQNESGEQLVKLYKAAADFNLSLLKRNCLGRLQDQARNDLVLRGRLLEVAEQNKDEALKEAVMAGIADV